MEMKIGNQYKYRTDLGGCAILKVKEKMSGDCTYIMELIESDISWAGQIGETKIWFTHAPGKWSLHKEACVDHEWVIIYEGDPIYEGTFCKKCSSRKETEL